MVLKYHSGQQGALVKATVPNHEAALMAPGISFQVCTRYNALHGALTQGDLSSISTRYALTGSGRHVRVGTSIDIISS